MSPVTRRSLALRGRAQRSGELRRSRKVLGLGQARDDGRRLRGDMAATVRTAPDSVQSSARN
jgi:hypothetical protein